MDVLTIFYCIVFLIIHFIWFCRADTNCGIILPTEETQTTIASEKINSWPWNVAILNSYGDFLTSGSIISKWFVLTIAHITYTSESIPRAPNDFVIAIGMWDLTSPQTFSQKVNVFSIIPYGGYNQRRGIDDLALFKTVNSITFSHYISAICLWSGNELDNAKNEETKTLHVGWISSNEQGVLKFTQKAMETTRASFESCSNNSETTGIKQYCFKSFESSDFCLENGEIYTHHKDVWYLRGIVSTSLSLKDSANSCTDAKNVPFVNIAYYQKWIEKHVFPTKHNLLGIEDCGIGLYADSEKRDSLVLPQQHPWIVQLAYQFWGRFNVTNCHGVLIHPEFVVTSSKCKQHQKLSHVILGASSIGNNPYNRIQNNIQIIEIAEDLFSDFFDKYQDRYDIDVIRLARKADITNSVKPVCLPSGEESIEHYNMMAWNRGDEHPKLLKSSSMKIIPFTKCQTEYLKTGVNVSDDNYLACFEFCQHESRSCEPVAQATCPIPLFGAPLFYTKHDGVHTYTYLVGIRSFGSASCGEGNYQVFNDIVSFRSEIEEIFYWRAWFDEGDDHFTQDLEDAAHTVHFEFDDVGKVIEEYANVLKNLNDKYLDSDEELMNKTEEDNLDL